jgi:hypothetical protein
MSGDQLRDNYRALRVLMCEALEALEHHREQTRPIDRCDTVITKLRRHLIPCGECVLERGEVCEMCRARG